MCSTPIRVKSTRARNQLITYTAKATLNYLKLPLLLRFNSDPNSVVQFNAFLGPQFSFLLSYKDRFEANVPLLGTIAEKSLEKK
jgi:hypothetical protein